MSVLNTILTTPVNVRGLVESGAPRERLLDGAFLNLVRYAELNWHYAANSSKGGKDLLDGSANTVPCGGIATALKLVFLDLGVPKDDIGYIRLTGYLWTGPAYLCFDRDVKGNVSKLETPGHYGFGCIFNEHYYLQVGEKYYDPCLSVSYPHPDQSVKERFNKPNSLFNLGKGMETLRLLVTEDKSTAVLSLRTPIAQGFGASWGMFDLSKKNLEKALGSKLFKAEMIRENGSSPFAKLVGTLPV